MRVPKIYLETSVFNFIFADDAPDKRDDTLKLFEEIRDGKYEPYTSECVTNELAAETEEKRLKMMQLIEDCNVAVVEASDEALALAEVYVAEGVIPPKCMTDALHVSIATVMDMDFIVSLNFKHIVKRKTVLMTEFVNVREGYRKVGIHSPAEVIEVTSEPKAMKEIHDIRERICKETKHMSDEEFNAWVHARSQALLAKYGIILR